MAVTCRNLYHFNPLQLGYDPRVKFFTVVYYSAKCSLFIASPCEYLSVKEERRREGGREGGREGAIEMRESITICGLNCNAEVSTQCQYFVAH